MIQMYDGVVNSIETVTTGAINATDTIINVLDETRIPDAPNLLVLGSGASAETVKLVEKNGSVLTVERGLQGTAKSWASGTLVARNFTEYDHRAFKENIETLNTNQQETNSQLAQRVNKAGDTMTGNLNLPTINDKTPAYAITPTQTITITSGFASGWSGTITVYKTQENILLFDFRSLIKSSTISASEVVFTLPVGYRPSSNLYIPIAGHNTATNQFVAGSMVHILIETGGAVSFLNIGSVTANVNWVLRAKASTL